MNKLPALILLLAVTCRVSAQLPQGAVVPDFTAQDINGQTWHLYDLLDQGKVVILEISATWCPPCWAYHNGHALQDFYLEHGPEGDNKAEVLFIEGDPETNFNCLFGQSGCNDFSTGNWVEGVTYPIFDNAALADSFQATYYPTLYMICPNKKVYQVGQMTAEQLWEKVSDCPVASGANNAGIFYHDAGTDLREVCDTLTVTPSFTLINLGSNPLTSAAITLQWNDSVVQTQSWSGYLPLYGESTVTFDPLPLCMEGILKTTIVSISGGQGDDDYSNNVHNDNFFAASEFQNKLIILKIKTDDYGAELYWELHDEQGEVLFSGGNKNVGPDGGGTFGTINGGPGAYGNNVLITKMLELPGTGCYSILFVDAYGDGICCAYGNGYYKLFSANNPAVPVLTGGEFGATDHRGFSVTEAVSDNTPPDRSGGIDVFPNPAGDQLNIAISAAHTGTSSGVVVNTLGQIVYRFRPEQIPPGGRHWSLPLAAWPPGPYHLHFQLGTKSVTRTFLVGK